MTNAPDQLEAAPPDDGGHRGSATLGSDMMATHEEGRKRDGPPLHQDATDREAKGGSQSWAPWAWAAALTAMVLGLVIGLVL